MNLLLDVMLKQMDVIVIGNTRQPSRFIAIATGPLILLSLRTLLAPDDAQQCHLKGTKALGRLTLW